MGLALKIIKGVGTLFFLRRDGCPFFFVVPAAKKKGWKTCLHDCCLSPLHQVSPPKESCYIIQAIVCLCVKPGQIKSLKSNQANNEQMHKAWVSMIPFLDNSA